MLPFDEAVERCVWCCASLKPENSFWIADFVPFWVSSIAYKRSDMRCAFARARRCVLSLGRRVLVAMMGDAHSVSRSNDPGFSFERSRMNVCDRFQSRPSMRSRTPCSESSGDDSRDFGSSWVSGERKSGVIQKKFSTGLYPPDLTLQVSKWRSLRRMSSHKNAKMISTDMLIMLISSIQTQHDDCCR